jgi:hypothetical protein
VPTLTKRAEFWTYTAPKQARASMATFVSACELPDEGEFPMQSVPRFLQGIYAFEGKGMNQPSPLVVQLTYTVPEGVHAQTVYFRGGNAADELICVIVMRDGSPMRYFPIGAKGDVHVPLRVVEDLPPGTSIELHVAAPAGLAAAVVVDLGLVEV